MNLEQELAASGIVEQRIRDGNHSDLLKLIGDYEKYMNLRYGMLKPRNMPKHEGSIGAYNCTLELIGHVKKLVENFDGSARHYFLKDLESDEKQITRWKNKFESYLKRLPHYAEINFF